MVDVVGIIKDEITNDPLTRGYSGMTSSQVATDMNTSYRSAEGGIDMMLNYCIINRSRTNNGSDTVALPLLGRLHCVADASIGSDPFGTGVAGNQITIEMKTWSKTFLTAFMSPSLETLNFINSEIDAGFRSLGPGKAAVWKLPDINALRAFSQNQQSRAQELGLGRVKPGQVEEARRG